MTYFISCVLENSEREFLFTLVMCRWLEIFICIDVYIQCDINKKSNSTVAL